MYRLGCVSRSYEIEPVETKDRYGNVTLSYHAWKIVPTFRDC